ncbi:MAG TPA: 50S ribosomal protein L10 [Acidimicrobiales bacterium]|nr:50S ribosomal protein L10 [Acidimicrobiales bacterium]
MPEEPRPEKVAVVEEVRDRLARADGAIFTEYRGLKVQEMANLRRLLAAAGGEYKVYKNTLVRRAAHETGLEVIEPMLEGPTGIAFVEGDAAAVAKVLRDFAKTSPALVVKGGLLGTSYLDGKGAAALADLPSREALLAQIAGVLAAPMQKFAGLLKAVPQSFAYGLKALIEQRGGDVTAAPAPSVEEDSAAEVANVEVADVEVADVEVAADEPAETAVDETAAEVEAVAAEAAAEIAAEEAVEAVAEAAEEASAEEAAEESTPEAAADGGEEAG